MTTEAASPRASLDELRTALNHLLGADRRLRGRDHSRPGELTHGQLRTISALGREREMTAGQLARSADLTPAAVTAILDQLEASGIVERHRSTADRRVCNVSLTAAGWQVLERKLAAFQALWAERLSEFSEEEIETAVRVLGRATDVLETLSRRLDAAAAYSSSGDSSTP